MCSLCFRTQTALAIGLALCLGLAAPAASDDTPGQSDKQAKAKPVFRIPATPYHVLAFSPDGKLFATAENDLRLYDLATGRQVALVGWDTHSRCRHLAFSPDGRQMVSAHRGSLIGHPELYVYLWEVSPEYKLRRVAELLARNRESTDYFTDVYHASFSPDGRTVVAGSPGEMIYLWDCRSTKERLRLRGGVAAVVAADGRTLLALSHDGLIRRFDAASGQALAPAKHVERSDFIFTEGVAFAAKGERVAVWDSNQVLLQETRSGKRINRLTFPAGCNSVTLSVDGRILIVAEESGIWFFDAATGKELGWRKSGKRGFGNGGLALTADVKIFAWVENEEHVEVQTLQDVLAGCVKGPSDARSNPPDVPLQAALIARQDRYVLNLGKLTSEEFSRKMTRSLPLSEKRDAGVPDFAFPSEPRVDLEFQVRNTGKQPITFFPKIEPRSFLAGAGALNISWPCQTISFFPSEGPSLKPVTLGPGERYSVRVTDLKLFGAGSRCLWILPGEYSIYASCHMSVSPALKGTRPNDDGSGWIRLRSPALKVKVVEAEK